MEKQNSNPEDADRLRQKAEEQLKKQQSKTSSLSSETDLLKLIHELQVHQIELEMQNEELVIAKEKAEIAKEKYTELYDFAPTGYLSLTKDGKITELNFAAAQMLGKERSRLITTQFSFFVSAETKPAFNHFLAEVFRSKNKATCEVTLTANGRLPMHVILSGICHENGQYCKLTAIDITERKQAEEKLKELFSRQKAILSSVPDIICEVDNNKVYTWSNQAGFDFFGEDFIGKDAAFFFEGEQETYKVVQPLFSGNEDVFYVESWQRRKDGEKRLLAWWCKVLKDENGNVTGALSAAHDITERKQAEEALQSSHSLLNAALESTADGILIVSRDRVITRYNQKFTDMWRIPQDILTRWDDDAALKFILFQLIDPDSFLTKVEYLYAHPEKSSFDQLKFKDGRIFERYSQPQKIGADTVGRVWSFRDITERKQAEAEIQKKNTELSQLNATKDKFFSIIAHDLKSPFNSIAGFSELLVDMARDKDYDEMEKYAGIIHQSSHRAIDLLMNLMEWARLQTGRIEFNPELFEMDNLINNVVKLLGDNATQKKIRISKTSTARVIAKADKAMISTVLRNLVANAIKFTKPGGEIIISVSENNSGLTVTVKDNGIGIPAHLSGKLFRLDECFTTRGTEKEQGTGLGLILCKEFIDKHGGKIWVDSIEGKGSDFKFTMPKE